jgi:hypothetical protein
MLAAIKSIKVGEVIMPTNRIELDTSSPVACCVSMLVAVACELCCLPIMEAMCDGCQKMCCDTQQGSAKDKTPLKEGVVPDLNEMSRKNDDTAYYAMNAPDAEDGRGTLSLA